MPTFSAAVIGSFRRHYVPVIQAVKEFESFGVRVTTPAVSRIINPGGSYVRLETDSPALSDQCVQADTMRKIFAADLVYVVARDGYIGYATWYELGRVHERHMPVYYSDVPLDVPIDMPPGSVVSVPDLIRDIIGRGVLP